MLLRHWGGLIWLSCLALASLPELSFLASQPDTARQPLAAPVNWTVPAGPVGHVITHLDRDHLPDTVSGRTTASGRYLIEVHLSSQPNKVTITANGVLLSRMSTPTAWRTCWWPMGWLAASSNWKTTETALSPRVTPEYCCTS